MLMHHLWAFPERIAGGELNTLLNISGENPAVFFGLFGKICVSLFFFLGGYGIYMQSKKRGFSILFNIKKLCLAYWKVFLVFIPIAYLFFRYQPEYCADPNIYGRYTTFNLHEIISNFFGASSSLNGEWWFFGSYIVAIIMFPLWKKIINKLSAWKSIMLIIAVNIVMTYIAPALGNNEVFGYPVLSYMYKTLLCQPGEFFSCFFMGMLFAKNDWLIVVKNKLQMVININFLTSTLAIVAIIFLRQEVTGASLDIIWAPLLTIFLIESIRRIPVLPRILEKLGTHSTTMWLTHSFCCYYFFPLALAVTWFRWAVPSLLVLITMSYIIAIGFDFAWSLISKLYLKLKRIR